MSPSLTPVKGIRAWARDERHPVEVPALMQRVTTAACPEPRPAARPPAGMADGAGWLAPGAALAGVSAGRVLDPSNGDGGRGVPSSCSLSQAAAGPTLRSSPNWKPASASRLAVTGKAVLELCLQGVSNRTPSSQPSPQSSAGPRHPLTVPPATGNSGSFSKSSYWERETLESLTAVSLPQLLPGVTLPQTCLYVPNLWFRISESHFLTSSM